jgi:nucleoside-diphosphate-sugar epimerase
MDPKSDRILITGGGGFVGAVLTRRLIAERYAVSLLLRPRSRPWRLASVEGHYVPVWADLCDAHAVHHAVEACQPTVIIHLAAHGAYPHQSDRSAILASNFMGTANLLGALARIDYRAFVNVGSSSEYGHKNGPMRSDDVLEPRTDYGVAKAAATLLCHSEARKGRPICTVRIFSAYGAWEDPSRLVPYVMASCQRGESPVLGSGNQPRDFIHVDDVIDLLLCAADCEAARGRILHAGSGHPSRVRDMVETILAVCGNGRIQARYGAQPDRTDEPATWLASLSETTRWTGWTPRLDLRAGVERTWDWFRTMDGSLAA